MPSTWAIRIENQEYFSNQTKFKRTFYHIWFSKFETTVQNSTPCRQLVTLFHLPIHRSCLAIRILPEKTTETRLIGWTEVVGPTGVLEAPTNIMNPKSLEHLKRYKWKRLVVCWPVEGLWTLIWVKLSKNANITHSIHVWCIYDGGLRPPSPPPPPRMGWVQNLRFSYIFMEPAKTHGIYTVLTSSASETVVFAAFCNTTLYTTTLIVLLLQKQQQLLLLLPLLRTTTYYYVLLRTTTYYYVLLRTSYTYYYVLLLHNKNDIPTLRAHVHTYIQTNHKSIQTKSSHT